MKKRESLLFCINDDFFNGYEILSNECIFNYINSCKHYLNNRIILYLNVLKLMLNLNVSFIYFYYYCIKLEQVPDRHSRFIQVYSCVVMPNGVDAIVLFQWCVISPPHEHNS